MRIPLSKLNSQKIIPCPVNKYLIDWSSKSPSKPQTEMKDFLFVFWKDDCVCEEFRVPGSLLRCDFINFTKKIIIEVSPSHHTDFNKFFHKNRLGFLKSLKRDFAKEEWANFNNFKFAHVNETDFHILSKEYFLKNYDINL